MFPALHFHDYTISLGFDRGVYWATASDPTRSIEGIFDSDPRRAIERAKLEVLRSLADRNESPTLLARPDGTIVHANLEARKIFNVRAGERLSAPLPDGRNYLARVGGKNYWIFRSPDLIGDGTIERLELLGADSPLEPLDIAFERGDLRARNGAIVHPGHRPDEER
jgi:PAS domain-containing protein